MKTFRFKIFISNVLLLVVFWALIFPFVTNSVQHMAIQAISDRADELIDVITKVPDTNGLIQATEDQKSFVIFHIALYNSAGEMLYDSHMRRNAKTVVVSQVTMPNDVAQAFVKGQSVAEETNDISAQKLIYISKSFMFQGKMYVFRMSFPYSYLVPLKRRFDTAFLIFSSIVLVLFCATIVLLMYYFMWPIRKVITAIKPYQEGKAMYIPEISITTRLKDEFYDLATTVNSLSARIQLQIETLTRARNEQETILESLAEGVLAVDSKLVLSYANRLALKFLSVPKSFIGQSLEGKVDPVFITVLQKGCITRAIANDEIIINNLHLNAVTSPLPDGVLLVLQDKTTQYKILEMRKDFIANASHELKTPITIIRGFAETLHDHPELDHATIQSITEKILNNSLRLTKIVRNLLTLADIENLPKYRLEKCNVYELAQRAVSHAQTVHTTAQVSIECEENLPLIDADPELLEVALTNLIDNGAKYSKDTPQLKISLRRNADSVRIAVQDHGIGIPEADLEHIFDRFYTVNKAESKKKGGSGLGLSIVQTIVEKHFGTISVESRVNEGSEFTIELPWVVEGDKRNGER